MIAGGGQLTRRPSCYSADGRLLLVPCANAVRLYACDTGELVGRLAGHTAEVTAVVSMAGGQVRQRGLCGICCASIRCAREAPAAAPAAGRPPPGRRPRAPQEHEYRACLLFGLRPPFLTAQNTRARAPAHL